MATKTPRDLGYRMPAEWQPHAATWLSWPRPDGISFPDRYPEALPTLGEMVRMLAPHERVEINVRDEGIEAIARQAIGDTRNVSYHHIPSYEPWCRDHGPLFVKRDHELAIVDWDYNAWGGKYPPYDDDDAVPQRIGESLGLPVFRPGIVMEGGALDVNGAGTLLTTSKRSKSSSISAITLASATSCGSAMESPVMIPMGMWTISCGS